jgi:hypothetical protein
VELDLANNFLEAVPVQALKVLKNIKFLNLGSNKIKVNTVPRLVLNTAHSADVSTNANYTYIFLCNKSFEYSFKPKDLS